MKINILFNKQTLLTCTLFFCFNTLLQAQIIKGNITDAKTGETLIGATVTINKADVKRSTTVKLDGTYLFKNIPAGVYLLRATYLGYKNSNDYTVEAKPNGVTVLNIKMVDNSTSLSEVTIIQSADKGSDRSARGAEKRSNNTINAVSAQTIAISPDVLVSNVLSRVSGISIDRGNTGDARHVIIRGMNKQYNTTLINGIKIPSPDNKNRYVPLDIFPAGLVDRIDVYKTLTPDMEADASGGVVNLVMKTAPDKLEIEGDFGTGYSQLFFNRGFKSFNRSTVSRTAPNEAMPTKPAAISDFPYQNLLTKSGYPPPNATADLTIGNRYLNNKLGLLFSGSYQNLYQGSNDFVVIQENTVGPPLTPNGPNSETAFQSSDNRQYSSRLNRLGAIASVDYKFNDNNSINLFATYLQLNEYRVRNTENSTYGGYSYQGYHGTFSIDNLTETRSDLQNIYNITLAGKHKITKAFKFDWTIANSEAMHKLPDIAEFDTKYGTSPVQTTQQPTGDPQQPYTSVASSIQNTAVMVGNESREWEHNTDKNNSAYLNLHYDATIFGRKTTFSAGGMFRHKTRDNFVDKFSLPNTLIPGTNNAELYTSIPEAKFTFDQNPGNAIGSASTDPGTYTFTENIQGGYGMAEYNINSKLNLTFGLRAEHTYQYYYSNLPAYLAGKTATITYTDFLPDINAKYTLTNNQALRASYFTSVLRPAFADLIPYPDQTIDDNYAHNGNPNLQHTSIHNYDLRYEFFPGVFDEFMGGIFYKYLINPIEAVFEQGPGGATLYLTPENLGNAHNYGAELVAKKFFGNVGIAVNYTYTRSKVTTPKSIVTNGVVTSRDQTRPLQGQAANIGNFSLLYKDQKNGIDAQLSLSYTGERIQAVSRYYLLDTWERATTTLDFSVQKKAGRHFIIFAKANNLLNTPYELIIKQNNSFNYTGLLKYQYQGSPDYTTVEHQQFYARYSLGAKYNF
ncbi:MAG TPA: TonB-dependent receptor [Mucilaginibacter sp.]|nr:TonB-dependent receptor [Mucilaginibacter sp.]